MSKHAREKCGKLRISSILSSKRGITPTNIDANWWHSNLICSTIKQSHMQNFSSICQSMQEKSADFKFKRGHNSHKHWRKLTTLELDLYYDETKSLYAKFQLNMSKHVGEKCGKLHNTYILSSQRGITPSKIDAKWRQSNLICSTSKQSHVQNFSSICQSM